MKILNYAFILLVPVLGLQAQSFTEKITKELSFGKSPDQNTLMVANINGDINVTGYDGDRIIIEVNKEVRAKTPARLEKGKAVSLGVIDRADTIILYVDGICSSFRKQKRNSR